MEHTKEPWEVKTVPNTDQTYFIQSKHGTIARTQIGWGYQVDEANARRIVACVNALKGIGTAFLESLDRDQMTVVTSEAFEYWENVANERDRLATQNKRLREALDFLADGNCFEGLKGLEKDIYEYQYEMHCEQQSDDGEEPNVAERIEGLIRMIEDHKALKEVQ